MRVSLSSTAAGESKTRQSASGQCPAPPPPTLACIRGGGARLESSQVLTTVRCAHSPEQSAHKTYLFNHRPYRVKTRVWPLATRSRSESPGMWRFLRGSSIMRILGALCLTPGAYAVLLLTEA